MTQHTFSQSVINLLKPPVGKDLKFRFHEQQLNLLIVIINFQVKKLSNGERQQMFNHIKKYIDIINQV